MKTKPRGAAVRSASSAGNGASKLPVPESPGLRPTTDRVRRNPFNRLAPSIVDSTSFDCFAGSGALGLEALSRYAASTTLLEMSAAQSSSCKNLATLKADRGKVITTQHPRLPRPAGDPAPDRVRRPAVPSGAAGGDATSAGDTRLAGR